MLRTTALLVSVFVSTTVGASEWWFIGATPGENPAFSFVDKESLTNSGTGRIKFWVWQILSKDDPSPWGNYRTSKASTIVDCQSKTLTFASIIYYDLNGGVVDFSYWENQKWVDIIPDSIGELEHKFVCSRGKALEPWQTWAIHPEAYAERLTPSRPSASELLHSSPGGMR